jgi:mannosyltransferase OCH1-like enzyme
MSTFKSAFLAFIDSPFRRLENQIANPPIMQRIPPTVFQTWETKSFGRRHLQAIKRFREINRDLNFVLLDKNERDAYMRENWHGKPILDIYTRSLFGTLKADIFRYCIIFQKGGYYFDISKGTKKSITSLHSRDAKGILTFENNAYMIGQVVEGIRHPQNLIVQWGFGFEAGHPILEDQIKSIENAYPDFARKVFKEPKKAILEFSGPVSFTRTVHNYSKKKTLEEIDQLGIDFFGQGIFSLSGSESRYKVAPNYAMAKNLPILE